jgi:hypothetical protein
MPAPSHSSRHLSIAGLTFDIRGSDLTVRPTAEAPYRHFESSCRGGEEGEPVSVTLTASPGPSLETVERAFDASGAWMLYRSGSRRFVTGFHLVDGERKTAWIAGFDPDEPSVQVWCDERIRERREGREEVVNPVVYPLDQILCMYYLRGRGAILHAAGVVRRGKGYLFAGISGAGKTTIARLIADGGESATAVLSDDRIVVRRGPEGGFTMHGTPWPGEGGYARNERAPLAGIYFLTKDNENGIRGMTSHESLTRLLPVASLPWYDKEAIGAPMKLCGDLIAQVPCCDFRFRPDKTAVESWGSTVND